MTGPQNPYSSPNGQNPQGDPGAGQPWNGQPHGFPQQGQPQNGQPHGTHHGQPSWKQGPQVYGQPGPGYQYNPANPNQGRIPNMGSLAYYDKNLTDGKGKRLAIILAILLATIAIVAGAVYLVWNSRETAPESSVTTDHQGGTGGGTDQGDSDERPADRDEQDDTSGGYDRPRVANPDDYKSDNDDDRVTVDDVVIPPFPEHVGPYSRSDVYAQESTIQNYKTEDYSRSVTVHVHGAWDDFEQHVSGEPYGDWTCNLVDTIHCSHVDREYNINISISAYDMEFEDVLAFADAFKNAYIPN